MTQGKITASAAMLNVLKTWGVDTIYGIPSGTLSSLMDALAEDKDIRFLQVRHEETGALAAVMQAKFGGSIGVAAVSYTHLQGRQSTSSSADCHYLGLCCVKKRS